MNDKDIVEIYHEIIESSTPSDELIKELRLLDEDDIVEIPQELIVGQP